MAGYNNANNNNNKEHNGRCGPIKVPRGIKYQIIEDSSFSKVKETDTYIKSDHTRESDLEYYERRYYKNLKDDYCKLKISDSIYRCPFCYNKDYSFTDILRHASITL